MDISFSFGFFAVWSLAFVLDYRTAVYLLVSCILHESGHIIAAKAAGIPIKSLRFYCGGVGMKCGVPLEMQSFGVQLTVLASGCAVNIILALVFMKADRVFFLINTALAMYNLLPVSSLDGGRIIAAVVRYAGGSCEELLKKADTVWGIIIIVIFIISRGRFFQ